MCIFSPMYIQQTETEQTAVTHPWYSLDSPIGSPMNTCVHKQKNKGPWLQFLFLPAKPIMCIERNSGSLEGFFHVLTLENPREPCSTVGKPHLFLLLSCSETHLCLFLSLLITKTSFLWSTILHWPWLQCCPSEFAFTFSPVSCICKDCWLLVSPSLVINSV